LRCLTSTLPPVGGQHAVENVVHSDGAKKVACFIADTNS
jgi:hypothetical protein